MKKVVKTYKVNGRGSGGEPSAELRFWVVNPTPTAPLFPTETWRDLSRGSRARWVGNRGSAEQTH